MISLVLPCFNEAESLPKVVPPLAEALRGEGIPFELVLVDNGSTDRTGEVLAGFAFPEVSRVRVEANRGYGFGVRAGLAKAQGELVGFLSADGQVAPADVVRVCREALRLPPRAMAKACRVSRADGWKRGLASRAYNALYRLCLPVRTPDLNGTPKILRREDLTALGLRSDDWFLDPECMIRAAERGMSVIEVPVTFGERAGGSSHVRPSAVWEFLRNLVRELGRR